MVHPDHQWVTSVHVERFGVKAREGNPPPSGGTGHRQDPLSTSNEDVDIGLWIDTPFRYAILEEAAGILMQRRNSSAQGAAAYLRGTADALGVDLCGLALLVVDSTRH